MLKVILFDMDGTLINSDQLVIKIYHELTKKYEPIISFDSLDLGDVFASSYPDVLKKLYGHVSQIHLDEIMHLHSMYKHMYLKSFPGVFDMLTSLKQKGYKLGLVTSELRSIAIDELQILNLFQIFDHIVTFDDVRKPKPHAEGIENHLTFFNCTKDEVIYIGDQKSDGMAGENARIYSVLMDWNKNKPIDYKVCFDHVACDTEQLMMLIRNYDRKELTISKNEKYSILQLTDLHLMNGEEDQLTFKLIEDMINETNPHFIVFTGDQTMSKEAYLLYRRLADFMDTFKTPYTFVFGNHDVEDNITYEELIDAMKTSKYLIFDQGPDHLGYSNHFILLKDEERKVIGSFVFLDTHTDDNYLIDGEYKWGYGAINSEQIIWYERLMKRNPYPHLIFFHIPIPEIKEANPDDKLHKGDYFESPCTPPINTGFFGKTHELKQAKAMFFGHDHLNDFCYDKEGILLCYGRVSGHYDYAMPGFPKGARLINFHHGQVETKVILHQDIKKNGTR